MQTSVNYPQQVRKAHWVHKPNLKLNDKTRPLEINYFWSGSSVSQLQSLPPPHCWEFLETLHQWCSQLPWPGVLSRFSCSIHCPHLPTALRRYIYVCRMKMDQMTMCSTLASQPGMSLVRRRKLRRTLVLNWLVYFWARELSTSWVWQGSLMMPAKPVVRFSKTWSKIVPSLASAFAAVVISL